MSVSQQEMQAAVDVFLDAIGVRMTRSGQIVLHFEHGQLKQYEVNQVIKPRDDQPCRRPAVGIPRGNGHA